MSAVKPRLRGGALGRSGSKKMGREFMSGKSFAPFGLGAAVGMVWLGQAAAAPDNATVTNQVDVPAAAGGTASPTQAAQVAQAAPAQNSNELEEVIVTARKRQESLLDAPVPVTAFTQQKLEQYATQNFQTLAEQTPGLVVNVGGDATGATIALRGVKASDYDATFSQPVSTNLDGIQLSKALSLAEGLFDMQQVEILRGPQALFFGKNSPGGVINISTVDPEDTFGGMLRFQYDFASNEELGFAAVDTPIADGLSARLAVQARGFDGYFTNEAQPTNYPIDPITGASGANTPNGDEQIARLTLLYKPDPSFDIRAKLTYYNLHDS